MERFEASPSLHERKEVEGRYGFVQLNVTRYWKEVHTRVANVMLTSLSQYHQSLEIGQFWPSSFRAEAISLKRYLPDGRDSFSTHVDVMDDTNSRRFITAILYLNDPGGGETRFPGLRATVTPSPGRMLVFPPLWLYLHEGLPPRDRAKYILHTYLWYPASIPRPPG